MKSETKRKFLCANLVLSLLIGLPAMAMSSQNYEISQDSINFAGSDDGKSANYELTDTAGEIGSGGMDSESYSIEAGYRQMEEESPYLSFNVAAASQTTKTAYTAFGSSSVTVGSIAGLNIAVGDYIAVVENEGISQKVAIGKVLDISGNVISIDFWSGDTALMSATPSGIDDFAYKLSGNIFDMGVLSSFQVNTGLSYYQIITSAKNGYQVSVYGNHPFQNSAGATLASVTDNAVSVGGGEYGIRTTGANVSTSTIDLPVQNTPLVIASSSARADLDRSAVIYKASGDTILTAGHYTQSVTYIATLNF